jgi:hypothetical protein
MLELRSVCKAKQLQMVTRTSRCLVTCSICWIAASNNAVIFQEIYNYNMILMILFPKPAHVCFIHLWDICPGYLFYHVYIYIYISFEFQN